MNVILFRSCILANILQMAEIFDARLLPSGREDGALRFGGRVPAYSAQRSRSPY